MIRQGRRLGLDGWIGFGGFPFAADVHFMVIFGQNAEKVRRTGKLAS